ncbi:conserved exported hypothetical protein [Arthrobacter sp. 9AX]|uniref:hypothetical protein n=1 Tax=Arthrobacter sp. 9AX TaxID=2653131 RepID=UPI0012F37FDC|nr:hypothetical protein [Arthrobacter sp. 9AX]VXC50605.1 conserved exported hypothetical protein [Arthrobacter sp. 9AX]
MKRTSRITAAILSIATALSLSACAPTPARISALDREATAEDVLPAQIPAVMGEQHTTRLLAAKDGIRYFVAQADNSAYTCVTGYPDNRPELWFTGCSDQSGPGKEIVRTARNGVASVVLVPDGYDSSALVKDGFEAVHPNILVAGTSGRVPGA